MDPRRLHDLRHHAQPLLRVPRDRAAAGAARAGRRAPDGAARDGSNNPDGVEIKQQPKDPATGLPLDGIYSHPYYTVKDIVGVIVFLSVFSIVMFFLPEMGGYFLEANNFIPADPLKTPEHIAPVWYFTPYYAMLRAVPSFFDSQFWGVLVMGVVGADLLLPAVARPRRRSSRSATAARSTRAGSPRSSSRS